MGGDKSQQFAGKVAVVTGGTSGSGEATARLIASRGAAGVTICGRDRARGEAVAADISAGGCPALFVQADLADVDACFAVIDQAEQRFGRIDALCNVAGLSTRGGVADTTPEAWDKLFAVNVRAPFFLIQRTVAVMRKHRIAGAIAPTLGGLLLPVSLVAALALYAAAFLVGGLTVLVLGRETMGESLAETA